MLLRIAILLVLGALFSQATFATTPTPTPTPQPSAVSSPTSAAKAAADAAAQATAAASQGQSQFQTQGQNQTQQAVSGSTSAFDYKADSNFYVLPGPITGSNLPAGICQRSTYHHVAFGWNFVSVADGESFTDLECLKLWGQLQKVLQQPVAPAFVAIPPLPPEPAVVAPASAASAPVVAQPVPECAPSNIPAAVAAAKTDKSTKASGAKSAAKKGSTITGLNGASCKI